MVLCAGMLRRLCRIVYPLEDVFLPILPLFQDHFKITPIPLDHKRLFKLMTKRMGKAKHRYDDKTDGNAQRALDKKKKKRELEILQAANSSVGSS